MFKVSVWIYIGIIFCIIALCLELVCNGPPSTHGDLCFVVWFLYVRLLGYFITGSLDWIILIEVHLSKNRPHLSDKDIICGRPEACLILYHNQCNNRNVTLVLYPKDEGEVISLDFGEKKLDYSGQEEEGLHCSG